MADQRFIKPGFDLTQDEPEPPFAARSWHSCWSCRHDEGRGSGGSPPWHECSLYRYPNTHRDDTHTGLDCHSYAPLSWAINPKLKQES